MQKFIQKIDDQAVTIAINGRSFYFRFHAFRDLMYVDVTRNNNYILVGKRVMANRWILPNYVAEGIGNLRFETYESDGDDYVWYEGFNTKFRLMTYTDAEIKSMENEATEE